MHWPMSQLCFYSIHLDSTVNQEELFNVTPNGWYNYLSNVMKTNYNAIL